MALPLEKDRLLAGRYRIQELVGSGGSGWVYRAIQEPLERVVAVKVLRTDLPEEDQIHFEARFLREASLAGSLQHPHIITIHDYGRSPEGFCYLVMEHLEGYTLREVLRRREVSTRRVVRIFDGVAQGLRHAHTRGLVHRDVKPSNIFLVRGDGEEWRPKIMDFGLVREVHSEVTVTEVGTFLGTPQYIAPEQAQGEPADARSDVYSLGVVLYRALCGKLPYTATNPAALAYMHVHQPYPRMAERAPGTDVPQRLETICERCMRKDPSERYADAGAFLEDLRAVSRVVFGPDVLPPPDLSATRVAAVALRPATTLVPPAPEAEAAAEEDTSPPAPADPVPGPLPAPEDDITAPIASPPRPRRRRGPLLALLLLLPAALLAVLSCGGLGLGLQALVARRGGADPGFDLGAWIDSWLPREATELPPSAAPARVVAPPPAVPEPTAAVVEPAVPEEPPAEPAAEAPVPAPPPVHGAAAGVAREAAVRALLAETPVPDEAPVEPPVVVERRPTDDAGTLGLLIEDEQGVVVEPEVRPAPPRPAPGLVVEPPTGPVPVRVPPQRGTITVDKVTFSPEEASRTLAWVNGATEKELKDAGMYALGIPNILAQRPYESLEVFAATYYVGTSSVAAAKIAALR